MFVTVEGADGVGKATQVARLHAHLARCRAEQAIRVFSFPRYATPVGKAILRHLRREIAVVEAGATAPEDALAFQCMMATDKYDAAPEIEAALLDGGIVICDRWWQSALAYGRSDGLDEAWLERIHDHLPQPDLNILLEVTQFETTRRRPVPRDRYEAAQAQQAAVRVNYRALWEAHAADVESRWTIVDGEGAEDVVHARVWDQVLHTWPFLERSTP
jgi:thymidylate kinase